MNQSEATSNLYDCLCSKLYDCLCRSCAPKAEEILTAAIEQALAVQPKPQSCIEFLYEQLRKETDGASESMTHNDAIEIIRVWRDAYYAQKYPQPEQRPVATLWQHNETGRTRITMPGDITDCDARWFKAADLYTQPQAWVGLSDADLADCSTDEYKAARYWEAVLQEKNTKDQPS